MPLLPLRLFLKGMSDCIYLSKMWVSWIFISLPLRGQSVSVLLVPPTLIPLSEVGTTSFSSCCYKDSAIIFTTGRLPDVNPP
jgi:hypothetical protein